VAKELNQQPRRSAVTLDDVARTAGVSPSTVSRTLNGRSGKVSGATAARIRAVAQELGYTTNLAAQAMAIGSSPVVGFVVDRIPEDYQNPVAVGVFAAAARHDRLVVMGETDGGDMTRARRLVNRLRGQRPQLILIAGSRPLDDPGMDDLFAELALYEADGGRVVLIGQAGSQFDAVVVDDFAAGHAMAGALAKLGYREFSVFCDNGLRNTIGTRRRDGFIAGLAENGIELEPDRVIVNEFSHDGGYRSAGELLGRRNGTQAVFAVNDAVAIGALVRLREAGLRIGTDIAVAGCDDVAALRDVDPPLTTVRLPWKDVAEKAFELAADVDRTGPRTEVLRGYPVMRASTPGLE